MNGFRLLKGTEEQACPPYDLIVCVTERLTQGNARLTVLIAVATGFAACFCRTGAGFFGTLEPFPLPTFLFAFFAMALSSRGQDRWMAHDTTSRARRPRPRGAVPRPPRPGEGPPGAIQGGLIIGGFVPENCG